MNYAKQLDRRDLVIAVWAAEFARALSGTRAADSAAIQQLHTENAAASADRVVEALQMFIEVKFRLAGYGELENNYMPWTAFVVRCHKGAITDVDGRGALATADHYVSNVAICPSNIDDDRPAWATHVCWYPK